MEEKATLIESFVEGAEEYTKSSIDLLKLKAIDKSSDIISSVLTTLLISIAILCIPVMVNIGAALWIGKLFDNTFYGFFIVAAFYTVVAIFLFIFRKQLLKTPLRNIIIKFIRKEKKI